jgi:adenine-specific DNA-methyltransferase
MTDSGTVDGGTQPVAALPSLGTNSDPVTGEGDRPDGAGMYLHWDGRRTYRTRIPAPRVLEPDDGVSCGEMTGNRIIEGDNLQVMVSLRSQYRNMVNVAYLDPPYNTGRRDFRYSDRRFHDPNADADDGMYVTDQDGSRHTKWLNYMGPRLYLTWELLAEDGVAFVSINDIELYRLGLLMDEVFGERNRIGVLVWKQTTDNNPTRIATEHEYILCYAKNKEAVAPRWEGSSVGKQFLLDSFRQLTDKERDPAVLQSQFRALIRQHAQDFKQAVSNESVEVDLPDISGLERYYQVDQHYTERGPYAAIRNTDNPGKQGYDYDVVHPVTGKVMRKPATGYRFSPETFATLAEEDRVIYGADEKRLWQLKKYLTEVPDPLRSVIDLDTRVGANTLKRLFPEGAQRFKNPKPVELIAQLLTFAGDSDALVLDPFAGSGTTGHAVLRTNKEDGGTRRFIMIEEGTKEDRYCRTLTAPRVRAAIEQERLEGGFVFERVGRRLDRRAILDLEREAIRNLIVQTDSTGIGGGLTRTVGHHVVAINRRRQAICLYWNGKRGSTLTPELLTEMFDEVDALRLERPIRVYASASEISESESFTFCQIPDEILLSLQIQDEEEASPDAMNDSIQALELSAQFGTVNAG